MQLKIKLLIGFMVMLLLSGVMTFLGWRSMELMNTQANISGKVAESQSQMLLAQCRQLLYGQSRDKTFVAMTNKNIGDSVTELRKALELIWHPERKALAQESLQFLDWFKSAFAGLVKDTDNMNEDEAKLSRATTVMLDNFDALVRNVSAATRSRLTEEAVDGYEALRNAQLTFYEARVLVRQFVEQPSQETADAAVKTLLSTREQTEKVRELLRMPENVAACTTIVAALDVCMSAFGGLRRDTLTTRDTTVLIRQKTLQNIETMQRLSHSAIISVGDVKTSATGQLWMVAFVAFLVGVGTTWLLTRNVQRQLGKDPGQLADIARRVTEGDYRIDDGSPRRGVYGNIVGMVEALKQHLENAQQESNRAHQESERAREAVKTAEQAEHEAQAKTQAMLVAADRLEDVAHIVSSASTQLSAQIELSEKGASDQALQIAETAEAMDQMNTTVLEVARNASMASEVSASTRQKAEAGAAVVRKAVAGIQRVREQSVKLKDDMARLDESAKSISQIMGVISDIADQTNLLALNAAIEAARAGEAGRGFAVVADEVRKLAEKTMASTADVGNAIQAIQKSADESRAQADLSVQSVEDATNLVNQTGEALTEIVAMVDHSADQVHAIATAAEEQSATSEAITRSVDHVSNIAEETTRAMAESASAVTELSRQVHVLSDLIEQMKNG